MILLHLFTYKTYQLILLRSYPPSNQVSNIWASNTTVVDASFHRLLDSFKSYLVSLIIKKIYCLFIQN
jgi:hypothetical protein